MSGWDGERSFILDEGRKTRQTEEPFGGNLSNQEQRC